MLGRPIQVLVVDDSAFMRRAILRMLEREDDIQVIDTASSGEEAIEKAAKLRPDVITMDVEMPGMGGLNAVKEIVARRPIPIIMVSSLTREGAETTLRALELGACDFIPKPDSAYMDILKVARDLVDKVRALAGRRPPSRGMPAVAQRPAAPPVPPVAAKRTAPPPPPIARPRISGGAYSCVALGTSTGGPVALGRIIPFLPRDFPIPVIVVQHMPPGFTRPLSERLNSTSAIDVVEGEAGMLLRPGVAIIAPAGKQLKLRKLAGRIEVVLDDDRLNSLHVPSVDVMAASAADAFGSGTIGVILTGMGHDGVEGLRHLKELGGHVIGQDEASCVVYGMPRAAALAGLVDRVLPLDDIASVLCELTGATPMRS